MTTNQWINKHIPSQEGKVIIITGSNSGIGFEAAKTLAQKSAEVVMAVRNLKKGESAAEDIRRNTPDAQIKVMRLDLADLESVKLFSESFHNDFSRLDVLLNNAGVMVPPYTKTKDGFELQIGVNHLGHFALTAHLFDLLKNTPDARIVNVSSIAHKQGKMQFDDLHWEKSYSRMKAYAQSKLANLLFTYELARKVQAAGLNMKAVAAHPGVSQTNLMRYMGFLKGLMKLMTQPASRGALPLLMAAASADAKNADYFGPDGWREMKGFPKKADAVSAAHDQAAAEKLWLLSGKMTGVKFEI